MTYSILAYDTESGRFGGAAATGSLCVGGWVLRGDPRAGLTASQGTSPSTIWGEVTLAKMAEGHAAKDAVKEVVENDAGRTHRQLAAIDCNGWTAAFSGDQSLPVSGHQAAENVIVAGNMLANSIVLGAVLTGFVTSTGTFEERLLTALDAGNVAGGDSRGLMSAALLVIGRDMPPLSLRIDHDDTPLAALRRLYSRSQASPYHDWLSAVPTLNDPQKSLD